MPLRVTFILLAMSDIQASGLPAQYRDRWQDWGGNPINGWKDKWLDCNTFTASKNKGGKWGDRVKLLLLFFCNFEVNKFRNNGSHHIVSNVVKQGNLGNYLKDSYGELM